MLYKRHY